MTKELKQLALTTWKELLVSTRDYVPFQQRSFPAHENTIKRLKSAMRHYKEHKPPGEQCVSWDHNYFLELQKEYYIPQAYCDPEMYFKNLKKNSCFAYYNRPCSVREYYESACQDTPGYIPKHGMTARQAREYSAPIAYNPGFQRSQASPPKFDEDEALARWRNNLPITRGMESSSATNDTTKLSQSQIWAAEQLQLRRQKAQVDNRRVPIPEEEDSENDTEPDDSVFDEHLLPHDKLRIGKLQTELKRIRSGNYPRDYLNARDRDIKAAEHDRLKGGKGPLYLAGCKTPWSSGMGHAPQRYDDYQKERIMMKIAKIKKQMLSFV